MVFVGGRPFVGDLDPASVTGVGAFGVRRVPILRQNNQIFEIFVYCSSIVRSQDRRHLGERVPSIEYERGVDVHQEFAVNHPGFCEYTHHFV